MRIRPIDEVNGALSRPDARVAGDSAEDGVANLAEKECGMSSIPRSPRLLKGAPLFWAAPTLQPIFNTRSNKIRTWCSIQKMKVLLKPFHA
jgi:hypothetical protein